MVIHQFCSPLRPTEGDRDAASCRCHRSSSVAAKAGEMSFGNLGLNTITGGTSRRNWSATGRFPCFLP